MSHTPGPWIANIPEHLRDPEAEAEIGMPYHFIDSGYEATGKCSDSDKGGFHIAAYLKPSDAALIAAAPELLEACKEASSSLHSILAVAYRYEPHFKRIVCGTCNVASPQNGDGNSFAITHGEDCQIGAAIKSERALDAAIKKAEAQQ